jgi:hypothetical protein
METLAVIVFPVAKPDEWRVWVDSIASGDRADAHRQMMRRLGIKREHIRHQASPAGDVMVLIWEALSRIVRPSCWPTWCRTRSPSTNGTSPLM